MSTNKQALREAAQEEIMLRSVSDTSDAWQDEASPEAVLALLDELEAAEKRIAEPVSVPDESAIFEAAIDICRKSDAINEHAWNHGVLAVMSAFRTCRAAMLQAGNSPVAPDCWCRTCRPVTMNDMRFVVCPECGNKRCPRANDHRNACTGSNEPDQEGSAYPTAPKQEVKSAFEHGMHRYAGAMQKLSEGYK